MVKPLAVAQPPQSAAGSRARPRDAQPSEGFSALVKHEKATRVPAPPARQTNGHRETPEWRHVDGLASVAHRAASWSGEVAEHVGPKTRTKAGEDDAQNSTDPRDQEPILVAFIVAPPPAAPERNSGGGGNDPQEQGSGEERLQAPLSVEENLAAEAPSGGKAEHTQVKSPPSGAVAADRPDTTAGRPHPAPDTGRQPTGKGSETQPSADTHRFESPARPAIQRAEPNAASPPGPSSPAAAIAAALQSTPKSLETSVSAGETVTLGQQSLTQRQGITTRSLEIRLNPAELGSVTATLKLQGSQLSIEIVASSPESQRHLSSESERISASLRALGYDVQTVTVLQPAIAVAAPARTDAPVANAPPQGGQPGSAGSPDGGGQGQRGQGGGSGSGNATPSGGDHARRHDTDRGLYI